MYNLRRSKVIYLEALISLITITTSRPSVCSLQQQTTMRQWKEKPTINAFLACSIRGWPSPGRPGTVREKKGQISLGFPSSSLTYPLNFWMPFPLNNARPFVLAVVIIKLSVMTLSNAIFFVVVWRVQPHARTLYSTSILTVSTSLSGILLEFVVR